ncbi:hypothetical protein [Algibacter aquimarinus]|uniref:Uncharacterized protein n=1 Tax=Algibacter aquimarinus TaxID=1136748 RepID=A0ABP9HDN9_9FLAO
MKKLKIIFATLITILLIVITMEVGKSFRISQLKEINESSIRSMGEYEKNSKTDYLKVFKKDNCSEKNQ